MNTDNYSTTTGSSQQVVSADRFKPLFKNTAELSSGMLKSSLRSDLNVDINLSVKSGRQVFARSIEFSLGVKLESAYEFKMPSPKDVASTVLGFVENRLNSEKAAGASDERLSNLLAQARAGVEKGYAQAEKDIKDLGLMTDELSEEIAEGYELITQGLTGFESKFLVQAEAQDAIKQVVADKPEKNQPELVSSGLFNSGGIKKNSFSANASSMQVNSLSANSADFVLKTREGDLVMIKFADIEMIRARKDQDGLSLDLRQQSLFQFSVEGDLNEDEIAAINDVLTQVGNISTLFFSDQFEQAFDAALKLGFDSGQIASLSLDLSKTQMQEVRVYDGSSKGALESYKRNQPLINMAQQFERLVTLLSPLERFEKLNSLVDELVSKAIERYSQLPGKQGSVDEQVSINKDYKDYAKELLTSVFDVSRR